MEQIKILIAGCGYVGAALGVDLLKSGAEVWGLRRDAAALEKLKSLGIKPLPADLLDPKSLANLPPVDFVVMCQALSRKTDSYQKTYCEGTRHLLSALKNEKPKKLVLISSTSVYSVHDGSWVDESTDPGLAGYLTKEAGDNAKCLLEAEKAVLVSGIPSVVFRLGGIYGPGRNRIKPLKEGRITPSFSEIYTNRIHVDDVVRGIELLMENGKSGEIYLGVDDEPCTQKEFYGWLCDKLSLKPARDKTAVDTVIVRASNKRCSNAKLKALGMKFKYPTFREGYEFILTSFN